MFFLLFRKISITCEEREYWHNSEDIEYYGKENSVNDNHSNENSDDDNSNDKYDDRHHSNNNSMEMMTVIKTIMMIIAVIIIINILTIDEKTMNKHGKDCYFVCTHFIQ